MALPYKVTLVDEQPRVNEAGKVQTMKVVHYLTATGDRGPSPFRSNSIAPKSLHR